MAYEVCDEGCCVAGWDSEIMARRTRPDGSVTNVVRPMFSVVEDRNCGEIEDSDGYCTCEMEFSRDAYTYRGGDHARAEITDRAVTRWFIRQLREDAR